MRLNRTALVTTMAVLLLAFWRPLGALFRGTKGSVGGLPAVTPIEWLFLTGLALLALRALWQRPQSPATRSSRREGDNG